VRRAVVAAAAVALGSSAAEAQVYTRRNVNGVLEATNVPDRADYRLTYPGKGVLIHSRSWRLRPSYGGQFDHHILAAAGQYGVAVELVRAIIQAESDFDHLAVSSKGARGLMQLMPATARQMGVSDAFEPRQNVFGGVKYLRLLLDMFGGDVSLAAAAYNAGENAVLRYGGIPPFRETRRYVDKVQALLGGLWGRAAHPAGQLASYVPSAPALLAAAPATPLRTEGPHARGLRPARPQVYYKWTDARGVLHVGHVPPPDGVTYTMIRALD
jgi:hypothetical protein